MNIALLGWVTCHLITTYSKTETKKENDGVISNGSFVVKDPYPNNTVLPFGEDDQGRKNVCLYNFTLVDPYIGSSGFVNDFDVVSNQQTTNYSPDPSQKYKEIVFRPMILMIETINDIEGKTFTDRNGYEYVLEKGSSFIDKVDDWGRSQIQPSKKIPFYYPLIGDLIWHREEKTFYFIDNFGSTWKRSFKRN